MQRYLPVLLAAAILTACNPKIGDGLRKKDLTKDVEMVTDKGTLVIRLSDLTPVHRNNFLHLVKTHFYDGILFHRVINHFMVQAGDPATKITHAAATRTPEPATLPAEINAVLFHQKGVIAAARQGDDVNPLKASSSTQFYLVQGKTFTDAGLDSIETFRLKGRKLPIEHRAVYKTLGGTPHLDSNYTVFGNVVKGLATIDSIAVVPTNHDRPVENIKIIKARLVKRRV